MRIFIFLVTLSSFFYAKTTEEQFKIHTSASICNIKEIVQSLKTSIQKDDIESFSKFVAYKYPAIWNHNKKKILIKNKEILTQQIKDAILNIDDDLSNLFVNSQGIMIGNSESWFDPVRGGILAFNS